MSKLLRTLLSFLCIPLMSVSAQVVPEVQNAAVAEPLIAVFVANRAKGRAGLDEEVDGIRDLITAQLAGEFRVMDPQDLTDAFRKWKVSSVKERERLVEGVFTGGSVVRIAEMEGADLVMTVSVTSADVLDFPTHRNAQVSLTTKILDAQDAGALEGFTLTRQLPIRGVQMDNEAMFRILFRDAAREVAEKTLQARKSWDLKMKPAEELVQLQITTPIDALTDGLSEGARAPNDLLDELRRVVGGVTVWVDGAVVGSTPGVIEVKPGFHTIRVTREWMTAWEGVVHVKGDMNLDVALELSEKGVRRWKTVEALKADVALAYARALLTREIKVNFDTENWRSVGSTLGSPVDVIINESLEVTP